MILGGFSAGGTAPGGVSTSSTGTRGGATPSTGTYLQRCPPGQVVLRTIRGVFGAPDSVVCGYPAAPAPQITPNVAPTPLPDITTTVSPVFQQDTTSQVSPAIQTQVDSPGANQDAATEQAVSNPQQAEGGGTGGGGLTASDIALLLASGLGIDSAPAGGQYSEPQVYSGAIPPPIGFDMAQPTTAPAPAPKTKPNYLLYALGGLSAFLLYKHGEKKNGK